MEKPFPEFKEEIPLKIFVRSAFQGRKEHASMPTSDLVFELHNARCFREIVAEAVSR